jgi:hypothetical protein
MDMEHGVTWSSMTIPAFGIERIGHQVELHCDLCGKRHHLHTLLCAGGECTGSLLGNAVRLLAGGEQLQDPLRRNPEGRPAFIEEALRLEKPFRYPYVPCQGHDARHGPDSK